MCVAVLASRGVCCGLFVVWVFGLESFGGHVWCWRARGVACGVCPRGAVGMVCVWCVVGRVAPLWCFWRWFDAV